MITKEKKAKQSISTLLGAANKKKNASNTSVSEVNIEFIDFDPLQPRKEFDEEAIKELADSIIKVGLIQPLIIRKNEKESERYIIVAGERRYRACKLANFKKVPVVINDCQGEQLKLIQLAENASRADLSSFEYVEAIGEILTNFALSYKELGDAISKSKSRVSEYKTVYDSHESLKSLLKQGVKLRPVVELCRLYQRDPDFILDQINEKEPSDIDKNFVDRLKNILDQDSSSTEKRDELSTEAVTNEEELLSTEAETSDEEPLSTEAETSDEEPLSTEAETSDEEPLSTEAETSDEEPLSTEAETNDEESNFQISEEDLNNSFKKRSASKAVIKVEFKGGVGDIAASYSPHNPGSIPLELDDGTVIVVPIEQCKIIGYE